MSSNLIRQFIDNNPILSSKRLRSDGNLLARLVCILLFQVQILNAQSNPVLDSLLVLNQKNELRDTAKIKLLIDIATIYLNTNANKGLPFAEEAVTLAQSVHQNKWTAASALAKGTVLIRTGRLPEAQEELINAAEIFEKLRLRSEYATCVRSLGVSFAMQSKFKDALENLSKALEIFQQLKLKKETASCINNIASCYMKLSDNENALKYYQEAFQVYKSLGDNKGLASSALNTGTLYNNMGNLPKALEYYQIALKLNEEIGNQRSIAIINDNLSVVYKRLSEYRKAFEYSTKALNFYLQSNDPFGVASGYVNLGSRYLDLNDEDKAYDSFQKALTYLEKINDPETYAKCITNIALILEHKKDYAQALDYYQKANKVYESTGQQKVLNNAVSISFIYRKAPDSVLTNAGINPEERFKKSEKLLLNDLVLLEKSGQLIELKQTWGGLSETYESMGDYKKAYDAFIKYSIYRDSISGDDVKNQITRKEIQYEYDKKETALKYEQQLTTEQLEKQKLLSTQQQQALRLQEQALTISNKEKDLQHLAYLKEKAEKQEKEQALNLAEKDKQLQAADLATLVSEKALQIQSLARKNALIGFLFASLAAFLLAALAWFLWQRQKQARKEANIQNQFTRQLFENTEDERGRIARDLHDGVSHELLALKQQIPSTDAAQRIDAIINDIRQISRNLHPVMLESIGLKLSLETLCDQYMERGELFVSHDIQYEKRLPATAELQLFRIVQEAITNTIKYASANAAKVTLTEQHNLLQLCVEDNGHGFDVDQALNGGKAFGLRSILQRSKAIGGQCSIRSSGKGTVITLVLLRHIKGI
jgi:two-component system NarL family sensor kinase